MASMGTDASMQLVEASQKKQSLVRTVQEPTQAEAESIKRKVALLHTGFLLAVFTPPLMLCFNVVSSKDFRYFVGIEPLMSLFALAFILLVPAVDLNLRPASWWFLASVWMPAALFVLVGGFARMQVYTVMASLDNQDCGSFAEKRDLARAHDAALLVYDQCSADPDFTYIERCPGFDDLWRVWGHELSYLKAMERTLPCAGFCFESRRLWYSPGSPAPACSIYVGQWLYGAYIQCTAVVWYSVFIVLAGYGVNEFVQPFLRDYWEPAVCSPLGL